MGSFDFLRKKERDTTTELPSVPDTVDMPAPPLPPSKQQVSAELPCFMRSNEAHTEVVMPPVLQQESGMSLPNQTPRFDLFSAQEFKELALTSPSDAVNPEQMEVSHEEAVSEGEEVPLESQKPVFVIPENPDINAPKFINITQCQNVIEHLTGVGSSIRELDKAFGMLSVLMEKEDLSIKSLHLAFDDMRRKFIFMDDILFELRR